MITRPPRRSTTTNGFTLVELVVVIMILGILAGVAAPKLLDVGAHASHQALVTEVQAIFDAAEMYAAQAGHLPRDATRRRTPSELADLLDASVLADPTPIGGDYDWQGPDGTHGVVGVSVQSANPAAFLEVDRLADDGNATTGWIRNTGARLDFLIEE